MTTPLLSICIATYNRGAFIGQTLESIIGQLTEEVEIVIADGASTDNTREVVSMYARQCSQINYVQLPVKGGVDQDFCKAVELAKGRYCWLFSDDDLLMPGAIRTVLDAIAKGFSLVIVNAQVMTRDFAQVLEPRRMRTDADEVFASSEMEGLFNRITPYISFIGCVVIDRDVWMAREKQRYFGTEFIHVGVIFQAPLPGPAMVIALPQIMIRCDNAQWTTRALEIWMYKWPNLLNSFDTISRHTAQKFTKVRCWLGVKSIITFRAMGGYSLQDYKKYFAADSALWWWSATWLIAVMPACVMNLLVLIYFKLFKKSAKMDIYYLEINDNNLFKKFSTKKPDKSL